MKRRLLSIPFVLLACSLGCEHDCSNSSPPPTAPIRFVIVDDAGNNLVRTDSSELHPDSVKLFEADRKTDTIFKVEFNEALEGFWFQADCFKNESGSSTLYLRLSSTDTDTLLVSYETIRDDCFTIYQYTHVLHNGNEAFASGETRALQIIK